MAGDNILGSIQIVVTGDTSELQADFQAAQSIAATAGNQIANALTAGLAPGMQRATGLVDQFGRSIQSTMTAAKPPVVDLTAAGNQLAQSIIRLAGAEQAGAVAAKTFGDAHERSVTQIQAVSGAIRVSEGSGGIRAAERFLTLIPGVGAAAQALFPIFGALAVIDIFGKMLEPSKAETEALDKLAEAAKAADEQFAKLTATTDKVNVEKFSLLFGKTAGAGLKVNLDTLSQKQFEDEAKNLQNQADALEKQKPGGLQTAAASAIASQVAGPLGPILAGSVSKAISDVSGNTTVLNARVAALRQQAEGLTAAAKTMAETVKSDQTKTQKDTQDDAARLQIAKADRALSANQQITQSEKQRAEAEVKFAHETEEARIAAISDVHDRQIAEANEQVRVAQDTLSRLRPLYEAESKAAIKSINVKAAAERSQADKDPNVQAAITVRAEQQKFEAQAKAARDIGALYNTEALQEQHLGIVTAQVTREIAVEWEHASDEVARAIDRMGKDALRLQEIQAKSAADLASKRFDLGALQVERQYTLNKKGDTPSENVDYLKAQHAQEEAARQAEIKGLREQAAAAEAIGQTYPAHIAAAAQIASLGDHSAAAQEHERTELEAAGEAQRALAQAAQLTADADSRSADAVNKAYAARTAELNLAYQQSLQGQLSKQLSSSNLAASISQPLAEGIMNGGKGLGKDIRESLKGLGKELLGTILQHTLESLIEKIGLETALQAILHIGTTAQTTAVAANTIAVTANTAALVAAASGGAASGIGGIFGTLATIFGGAATGGDIFGPTVVGEQGPELFIPHGSGTVIPNGRFMSSQSAPPTAQTGSQGSSAVNVNHFHINTPYPRETVRQIATYMKSQTPQFSPYSS